MERNGEVEWTSWQEDSHAKISALQEKEPGLMETEADFGGRCIASLAKWNPSTSSWKTAQRSLFEDSTAYLDRLPTSGVMRRGTLYPQPTAVRRTSESGCGFSLPTPTVRNLIACSPAEANRNEPSLAYQVTRQWAIPTVCGNYNRKGASPSSGDGLQTQVGGKLNPEWVAWLMGWPIGWASFAPLEMDRFQSWLQQHSEC
jgi:hypothetical protein